MALPALPESHSAGIAATGRLPVESVWPVPFATVMVLGDTGHLMLATDLLWGASRSIAFELALVLLHSDSQWIPAGNSRKVAGRHTSRYRGAVSYKICCCQQYMTSHLGLASPAVETKK